MTSVGGAARTAHDGGLPIAKAAAVRRPQHMWWMYLLVTFALAGMGSGAAQALFTTHDLGHVAAVEICLARHGVSLGQVTIQSRQQVPSAFAKCAAPYNRRQGMAILAGAGLVPGAAWLLMLCGGLGARWRLRRSRTELAPTAAARAAAGRFEAWCDAWNLTGRRRPRLRLAAPGTSTGQAFTTGLPLGRPLVVVPLGYAYTDPAQFDVVVLHELAHVRSRDLLWASSVWWAGWLSLPVLALALSPVLTRPRLLLADYRSSLWLAAALSAAVLVLRAALLRRRELAADQYAVGLLGGTEALRAALGQEARSAGVGHAPAASGAPGAPGTPGVAAAGAGTPARLGHRAVQYGRALTASHPAPAARAAAARAAAGPASPDRWEGGFAVTAATGLIAMFTFQSLDVLLVDLSGFAWPDPGLPSDLAFAAASLVWACVVVPAWTRRAAAAALAGSPPTWWGPVAGTVLGLIAGYFLQVPGASTVVGPRLFAGHFPLLLTQMAVATTGAGLLAAGVAAGAATVIPRTRGRALARPAAVLAAAIGMTTALSVMTAVLTAHLRWGSAAVDRTLLMAQGDDRAWRFTPLLLLAGFALAAPASELAAVVGRIGPARRWRGPARLRGRLLTRACLPVMAVAIVAGGLGAAASWQLRIRAGLPDDMLFVLTYQRFWICALAGWAAMAAILLTGRAAARPPGPPGPTPGPPGRTPGRMPLTGLPAALNAGFVTAALAGLLQFACAAAAGYGRHLHTLQEALRMPMWLLFVTTVVTLPWLLLTAGIINRIRRHPRPAPRNVPAVLGTGAAAVALTVALSGGILSPLTVARHDWGRSNAATASASADPQTPAVPAPPAAPAPGAGHASDPGRSLSQAAAAAALANIPKLLPRGRKLVPVSPPAQPKIRPVACRNLFAHDAAEAAQPRTATITRAYTFPAAGTTRAGVKLVLDLNSYVRPVRDFAANRNEAARCPHFTWPDDLADDGQIHASIFQGTPPELPYPAYRMNVVFASQVHTMPVITDELTDSVLVGHNLVQAEITYSYIALPPPPAVQRYPEQLAAEVLTTIVGNLRTAPRVRTAPRAHQPRPPRAARRPAVAASAAGS